MMRYEFKLPDIGEGVHEGEIVQWLVQSGQHIQEDQPLVEIMTDKVTAEIPSPVSGKLLEIVGKPGDVLTVGHVIAVFEQKQAEDNTLDAKTSKTAVKATQAAASSQHSSRTASLPKPVSHNQTDLSCATEVLAAPATRRLANALGVNLSSVTGSGKNGRITQEDVEAAAILLENDQTESPQPPVTQTSPIPKAVDSLSSPQSGEAIHLEDTSFKKPVKPSLENATGNIDNQDNVPLSKAPDNQRCSRVPYAGIRRKTGEHLLHAKQAAPHFAYVEEVDMTDLLALRETLLPVAQEKAVRLNYLPFIIKAVLSGLMAFPALNATLDNQKQEIVYQHFYNFGIAVATEVGLVVPVIHQVEQKGLLQLAVEIEALSASARNNTLLRSQLQEGTFTITSIGSIGGLLSIPIINHPEAAILGINKICKRPVVKEIGGEDRIVIRQMMNLSISCDHRLVDGAEAALFIRHVARYLETPGLLLLSGEA
jgi:pyruvate dehydrogenase E2 component (dihydrolipoamide acetyltransferase)